MKVSHELPLCLMHYAYKWNDYDYLLPVFLDRYEQYKLYFQKARKDKRFIIMDNSLFEGYTHTTEDLLSKIKLIEPNIFIVPDAWNNATTTICNAKSWIINYKQHIPTGVNLMAVCQGQDIGELITTYQILIDLGYKHIAINHSSIAYTNEFPKLDRLKAQMYGRMAFLRKLVETSTLRKSVHHHLLGASLPQEFMAYTDWDWVKTVDTSNPILVGAEGIRYEDNGINFKPEHKLEHYFEMDLSEHLEDIKFNINKFKQYIK
jgi:hypothetical protein